MLATYQKELRKLVDLIRDSLRDEDLAGKLWRGRYRGQTQKWFAFRFDGEDSEINLETEHPEFLAWKWVDAVEVPKLIVPFKRDIYTAILAEFAPFLPR